MEIELSGDSDPCSKYTKDGEKYLEITQARILLTKRMESYGGGMTHQIIANIVCIPSQPFKNHTYKMTCKGKEAENADNFLALVYVTPKQQMLSGQVDYRYSESVFKLIKNGFLDVNKLKDQKFKHDQHIHIKQLSVNGLPHNSGKFPYYDCHEMYPSRLIGDHGIYGGFRSGNKKYWKRMYFDPMGVGEIIQQ